MKTRLLAALFISSFSLAGCPSDTPPGGDDGGDAGGGSDGGDAAVECLANEVYDEGLGRCVPDFGDDDAGPGADADGGGGEPDSDVPCVDTDLYLDRDGDNYGVDDPETNTTQCVRPDESVDGYARGFGDCDDDERLRAPNGVEFCDELDNNCNDLVNEGLQCDFFANTRDDLMLIDPFEKTLQKALPNVEGSAKVREGNDNNVSFQDLETHPDGRLFAITRQQLYEYRVGSWIPAAQELGADGIGDANGFAIDRDGTGFVTAENRLYTVNMDTGAATLVGSMDEAYYSSGDCVVNKGNTLFMTSKTFEQPDRLVVINRMTAEATPLENDTGYDKIYALTAAWGGLFGLTGDGELIKLDERTGEGTLITTFDGETFFGSASTPDR